MRSKQKKRIPKPIRNPLILPMAREDELDIALEPYFALDAIKDGRGTPDDFSTLAVRINWAGILAVRVRKTDAIEVFNEGNKAVLGVIERHQRIGKVGVSGDELKAISSALIAADALMQSTNRLDHIKSLQIVRERFYNSDPSLKPGEIKPKFERVTF